MIIQASMTQQTIPLNQICPGRYQHRQVFKPAPLRELAESIRANGLINPPVVYRENGHYELLIGERRWRAVSALALAETGMTFEAAIQTACGPLPGHLLPAESTLPVRVCQATDPTTLQTLALVENLQREDLTPIEEAQDFAGLKALGHGLNSIARLTGKSGQYIKGCLDWLELGPEIGELLVDGELPKDHRVSSALLSLPDPALRLKLARQFAARRSPIKAIVAVCERARAARSAPVSQVVPVGQARIEITASARQEAAPSAPCLCPACTIKINELVEELCSGCREHGLSAKCLKCDGVIEVLNRLVELSEAVYAA